MLIDDLLLKRKEIANGYEHLSKEFKKISENFNNPEYLTPDRERSVKIYAKVSEDLQGLAKRYPA